MNEYDKERADRLNKEAAQTLSELLNEGFKIVNTEGVPPTQELSVSGLGLVELRHPETHHNIDMYVNPKERRLYIIHDFDY